MDTYNLIYQVYDNTLVIVYLVYMFVLLNGAAVTTRLDRQRKSRCRRAAASATSSIVVVLVYVMYLGGSMHHTTAVTPPASLYRSQGPMEKQIYYYNIPGTTY